MRTKNAIIAIIVLTLGLVSAKVATATLSTPLELRSAYNQSVGTTTPQKKIRILIVPGHDNQYWGTQFRNVKEGDMTVMLGENLYTLLKDDPHFETYIVRSETAADPNGYTDTFANYFLQNKDAITSFITDTHTSFRAQLENGQLQKADGVPHNNVVSDVGLRLYGINKWVNENSIDLVLHIHFNDNPARPTDSPGPYRGFAVYIPDHQYANSALSAAFGQSMYDQLHMYYSQSILPKEDVGVVEDQDLIAIGPGNSLKAGVSLIEYGYIYEPQFLDPDIRQSVIEDLAYQSYLGIHRFFGDSTKYTDQFGTPLLPYWWSTNLAYGKLFSEDVLRLQAALRYLNMYPVPGREDLDCRMNGNFSPCVKVGLLAFQKKYKIAGGDGTTVGPKTRAKLNKLFGN